MSSSEVAVNKTPMIVALVLSLVLVVGVLVGAKVVYNRAASQPVGMGTIDTPEASSVECQDFVAALPEKLLGHKKAKIIEPVPPGAAAWKSSSLEQITLRCGVNVPLQFTELSPLDDVNGTTWLTVVDATPGSTMRTYYALNREKVIAVTTDAKGMSDYTINDLGQELDEALQTLDTTTPKPNPVPLSDLEVTAADSAACSKVLDRLPESFSSSDSGDFRRVEATSLPKNMLAWIADGFEPIIIACGTEFPENYEAGSQLNQVNEVVWFEDAVLGNGTTTSTWFAVDRKETVAISMPQIIAQSVLAQVSPIVAEELSKEER